MRILKKVCLVFISLLIIPTIAYAKDPQLLDIASDLWQIIDAENFEYGGTSIPPTNKKIDCSAYVSWVLYELGFTEEFNVQRTTEYFNETDWEEKFGWEEIEVSENEDVTSKLQAGDILVRDDGNNDGNMYIVARNDSGTIYAYDAGSKNNWENSGGEPVDKTAFAKSDKRAGKIIRIGDLVYTQEVNEYPTCNNKGTFPTYDLTDEQLSDLAIVAYNLGGSVETAANEASLMANLFELTGGKYGSGAEGLYNYVLNSGRFGTLTKKTTDNTEILLAFKAVLINGKRTLPKYIDEIDSLEDINSITNGNLKFRAPTNLSYHKLYEAYETKLTNKFGSNYTFYNFNDDAKIVYGYTTDNNRNKYGDDCYKLSLSQDKVQEEKGTTNPDTSVISTISIIIFMSLSIGALIFINHKNYFKKI